MTITNYTFFSPNGDDFPVTANADGKLYMMLTGMGYDTLRIRHWKQPINTALNRVYTNTSVVLAGRYFELIDHSLALIPNATNYIHAVIDLSNVENPVTLTVEASNTSNATDINNNSGVIKRIIEIVTTNNNSVTNSTLAEQKTEVNSLTVSGKVSDLGMSNFNVRNATWSSNGISISLTRVGCIVMGKWGGSQSNVAQGFTYTKLIPYGYRPIEASGFVVMQVKPSSFALYQSGSVRYWGTPDVSGELSGTFSYFTSDNFP